MLIMYLNKYLFNSFNFLINLNEKKKIIENIILHHFKNRIFYYFQYIFYELLYFIDLKSIFLNILLTNFNLGSR